jgi:transcriptional regulator with XRE-family HTH domain
MTNVDLKMQKKKLSELATRIRTARKNAHLSQLDLGEGIGVSDKSISAYEQGRSIPPIEKLKKIATLTSHPFAFFTEENIDETTITAKLLTIERELAEVKKLLKKVKS